MELFFWLMYIYEIYYYSISDTLEGTNTIFSKSPVLNSVMINFFPTTVYASNAV